MSADVSPQEVSELLKTVCSVRRYLYKVMILDERHGTRETINNFVWRGRRFEDHPDWRAEFFPAALFFDSDVARVTHHRPTELVITLDADEPGFRLKSTGIHIIDGASFHGGHLLISHPLHQRLDDYDRHSANFLAALIMYRLGDDGFRSRLAFRIGTALRAARKMAFLSLDVVAARIGRPETVLFEWETGARHPGVNDLDSWCAALGLALQQSVPLIRLVPYVTPQLLLLLRQDPSRLCDVTPEVFERLTAERLDRMGFAVTLTGATSRKDGGIDIIAAKRDPAFGNFLITAQVKHHRGDTATGREPVDRILRLKNTIFKFGLVVTNTFFTKDAKWVAAQDDNKWFVRLRDFEAIKCWLEETCAADRDYVELPNELELAPGVRIAIPRPDVSKLTLG